MKCFATFEYYFQISGTFQKKIEHYFITFCHWFLKHYFAFFFSTQSGQTSSSSSPTQSRESIYGPPLECRVSWSQHRLPWLCKATYANDSLFGLWNQGPLSGYFRQTFFGTATDGLLTSNAILSHSFPVTLASRSLLLVSLKWDEEQVMKDDRWQVTADG